MTGISVIQVLSDATHYRPLVCTLCDDLVDLQSVVVTSRCSHPFCKQCLSEWVRQSSSPKNGSCKCPSCSEPMHEDPSLGCMELASSTIAARPMAEAQPLAFRLLQNVQITCLVNEKSVHCGWNGKYSEYIKHEHIHSDSARGAADGMATSSHETMRVDSPAFPQSSPVRPKPENARITSDPNSMAKMQAPVSPQRIPTNESVAHAAADVSANGLANVRDAPPNLIKRTKSIDPPPNGTIRNTAKPVPDDNGLKKRASSRKLSLNDSINDLEHLNTNHQQDNPFQSSINSLQGYNNSFSDDVKPMETLTEEEAHGENTNSATPPNAEKIKQTIEQAEKLKKQANAKFNKGDFSTARSLYTNGINLMASIPRRANNADGELLSNMHSNRAVTYFREKSFDLCIEDCNMAIKYDKTYEKSWIRKWRALMAIGVFEDALACLELGAETVSNPSKIRKELTKAREEIGMYRKAKRLLDEEEYMDVRDMLQSYIRNSDNIGLLHLAALADCGLGRAESALEIANKSLRFNPIQPDGLAIRGYALFLSGDTEKGTMLMQDGHSRDKENKRIKNDFQRCSKTHSALTKGRACVKRGRYMEAVEHFTSAIKESGKIDQNTVLFGMLRSERAEAWMLCDKFLEALKDCQDVLNHQCENAAAWTVRAEVMIALGKAEEAKKELVAIRKTWGAGNQTIEEGYRRVDFELRVMKADRDLMRFIKELDRGYVPEGGVVPETSRDRKQAATDDRRIMMERMSSRRSLKNGLGKQVSARRLLQETEKPRSKRNLVVDVDQRAVSSRDLAGGSKQKSSRTLNKSGTRKQSSRNLMVSSGHRPLSPRKEENRGDRPSSNRRLGGERGEDDRRAAMRKGKSVRRSN